ncbi:MAG: hypothetical protein ABW044_13170, partial [Cellvibrio sp.]
MKYNVKFASAVFALLTSSGLGAQPLELEVNAANSITKIQPTMYGIFFEDINFAADGGLYAEMVKNRSFEFETPLMGWKQPNTRIHSLNQNSGIAVTINTSENKANKNFVRITINDDKGYEIINEGFRGMGIKKDAL